LNPQISQMNADYFGWFCKSRHRERSAAIQSNQGIANLWIAASASPPRNDKTGYQKLSMEICG